MLILGAVAAFLLIACVNVANLMLARVAARAELYEIEPLDPWAWMAALSVLAVALAIAVVRPTVAAARVDPIAALRSE